MMPSATRRPSLCTNSLSLPPTALDFAQTPSLSQAISGIKEAAAKLTLNRCQFKRIETMCLELYQNPGRNDAVTRNLVAVFTRCKIWRSVDLLRSLVLVPDDMKRFERTLRNLGARQSFVPSPDDESSQSEAITSAILSVLSDEQVRSQAMSLRNLQAEAFVSHVQMTLDIAPKMRPSEREECIKALRKLAVEAEVLPSSLKLEEITFANTNPVAQGGFSDVYQGRWKDKLVAVKRPRIFTSKDNSEVLKQARREILLWRQLSHAHVLPLLGIFTELDRPLDSMVSEWMSNGTLRTFLTKPEHQSMNRLSLIYQLSSALKYLHTHAPPIAHGDIKASNIFVDANWRPVFGDFGLSCLHYNIDRTMSSTLEAGTVRWMAPELLCPEKSGTGSYPLPSLPSDVWAFAMLMLEIFTDEDPYEKEPDHLVITNITVNKKLPAQPDLHIVERGLTDAVWELMNECWNFKPEARCRTDYIERNLQRLSLGIQITAWQERTDTVLIPTALVQDVITSDKANWKSLDLKIVKERGSIVKNTVPMTVISITGNAGQVAEARLRISDAIEKVNGLSVTIQMHIPKQLHSRVIGQGHCHHNRLEKKHGVQIKFPPKGSPNTKVTIRGSSVGVAKAKADLQKMMRFEQSCRDVLKVSSRVAQIISERRHNILKPPLRELIVDTDAGTITLRGKREGIIFAQKSIQAIEDEVGQEVTEEITVNTFLHDMLKSDMTKRDGQAWADIVERCGGPGSVGTDARTVLLEILPKSLRVRGARKLVEALQNEMKQLMDIGYDCVLGKRISAHRHQSLLGAQSELIGDLRRHTKAMVYFPESGGYADVRMPENMYRFEGVAPGDIVKVVGSREACARAREYLETRVEDQCKKERNPKYKFPAGLHYVLKRKLDPMFKTLGVESTNSEVPTMTQSLLSFISEDPSRITASGPSWSIHERYDKPELPMCEWELAAGTPEALAAGGRYLEKEARALWRRIGVLKLQGPAHLRIMKEGLDLLRAQDEELSVEVIDQPNLSRLVMGGPSTNAIQFVINKAIGLIESSED